MYDAATPVSFYEHDPKVPHLIAAWLKGYKSVTALAREDEDEIPTSSCCGACFSSRGSVRITKPSSRSRWAFHTRRERSDCARIICRGWFMSRDFNSEPLGRAFRLGLKERWEAGPPRCLLQRVGLVLTSINSCKINSECGWCPLSKERALRRPDSAPTADPYLPRRLKGAWDRRQLLHVRS